jgi:hypothetical protein
MYIFWDRKTKFRIFQKYMGKVVRAREEYKILTSILIYASKGNEAKRNLYRFTSAWFFGK